MLDKKQRLLHKRRQSEGEGEQLSDSIITHSFHYFIQCISCVPRWLTDNLFKDKSSFWELLAIWSWPSHCFILIQKINRWLWLYMLSLIILFNNIHMGFIQEQLVCKLNKIPFSPKYYLKRNFPGKQTKQIKESHAHWIRFEASEPQWVYVGASLYPVFRSRLYALYLK